MSWAESAPLGASSHPVVRALVAELGRDAVTVDPATLAVHAVDASGAGAGVAPLALVVPPSTEQVAAVAAIASAHGVPLVPQGARTGLAGGAAAVEGSILLSLTAMAEVLALDTVDQVAVVQAGVVTADLATLVGRNGLFYAPDPASAQWSTLGGNVATNAGGMRCVKYGVTRNAVRSLELVLMDGTVVRTGTSTMKGVAGLDLTGLVVGSEGTLAVVTEMTLGLLPAPGPVRGVCATFPSTTAALDAVLALLASSRRPCTLELLDAIVLAAIAAHDPDAGLPSGAEAMLLVLTDSAHGGEHDIASYAAVCRQHGALSVDVAADPERVEVLLRARRAFNPAMRSLRGASLNEDVAVPVSRIPELLERLDDLSRQVGLPIGSGGHVGDGNLHPVIAYDPDDPDQVTAAHAAHEAVLALAVELGGTVTGEHGIGLEKRAALDLELGPALRTVQRGIKAVLDPAGLLNPGKKL